MLDAIYGPSPAPHSYARPVLFADEGAQKVARILETGSPCMIARLGSTELACINYFTRWRQGRGIPLPYLPQIRQAVQVNSGIFPADPASLDRFSEVYLAALSSADVLGVWFNRNEHRLLQRRAPDADLVELGALNCVLHDDPWSARLAGRVVLVVHPFAASIERQYRERRALLFENSAVLPEFELKTLPAVQSFAGNSDDCGYASWFDALEGMTERIGETGFDIAIIGAGAYGLPLAAAVKDMGRQAVHMGGATQLLFGIRGRRWEVESPDDIAPLFNEHWVRPSSEETPRNSELVEGGCYW